MTMTTSTRFSVGQQPGQRLVERAGLLLGVADGLDHLDAAGAGDLDRRVGAVVGDHDHAVRRPGLAGQGVEGGGEDRLLVVGGNEDGAPQPRAPAASSPGSGTAVTGQSGGCSMSSARTASGPRVHRLACCRWAGSGGGTRRSGFSTCIAVATCKRRQADERGRDQGRGREKHRRTRSAEVQVQREGDGTGAARRAVCRGEQPSGQHQEHRCQEGEACSQPAEACGTAPQTSVLCAPQVGAVHGEPFCGRRRCVPMARTG